MPTLTHTAGATITWHQALAPTNCGTGVNYLSIFYAYNISGTLTNLQVTATWPTSAAFTNLVVHEFNGYGSTDPLGNTSTGTGTSATASTGTITIPSSSAILFIAECDGGGGVFTSGTYTVGSPDSFFGEGWHIASSSEAASCTVNSGTWRIAAAAFTAGTAPATPNTPTPSNTASGVSTVPTLTWAAAGATTYDVYFGTAASPPLVSSGQAGASYVPGTLTPAVIYFWKIVAINSIGSVTGPIWSFLVGSPVAIPKFEVILSGSTWTDISADVVDSGVTAAWGITSGLGPLDTIAGSGTCTFMLRNDAQSGVLGRWSPNGPSCTTGWTFGIPFRLSFVYGATTYQRFRGKIFSILPDSGVHGRRQVAVTVYDVMRELAEVEVLSVGIQIGMTESQIITNVLSSLPSSSQPVATSIDTGVDTFPYALDTIGPDAKALSVIADVARSAFAMVACKSDGTFIVRNRHNRGAGSSLIAFDADFMDLQVPSDLSNVYNLVRVTIHPKTIDAAATTVLYALAGTVPSVGAGLSITLWGSYNDPTNAQKLVGGTAMVTTLVAGTDYAGNSLIDGTGSNQNANLTVTATAFATTVKFVVTNTSGATIFLIATGGSGPKLQIRGKGVYDRGPQTYQSTSTQPYGTRPIAIDMPYQNDPLVAQAGAEFVRSTYETLKRQVSRMSFLANDTTAHMTFALTVEPGDRITLSEPMTGTGLVDVVVQSVSLSFVEKVVSVNLTFAPASSLLFWLWGITGRSEYDTNTIYGF